MKLTSNYSQCHQGDTKDEIPSSVNYKRLLFADDDLNILEGYKYIFESEDFKVDLAENSDTLMKLLRENTYDVIILDYNMGDQKGIDTAEKILTITKDANIIFISGQRYAQEELKTHNIKVAGFFEKPLRAETLLDFVYQHLGID